MIEIRTFTGANVEPYLDAVAALRIAVFRDWPYLYEGDADYERKYLATYANSQRSLFVLAFDGERIVGASTGIPLVDEVPNFQKPFLDRNIRLEDVFYFGESVLLHECRGQGVGHRFFDERENYARQLDSFQMTAFCSVERSLDDPRRPAEYRGNDAFWNKRGYTRQNDMFCELEWKEIGEPDPSRKRLRFWLKPL